MFPVLYLTTFLCIAMIGLAVAALVKPRPQWAKLPKASRPTASLVEPSERATARRNPFAPLLSLAGRLLPAIGRGREKLHGRLVYIGSTMSVQQFGGLQLLMALGGAVACTAILQEFGKPDAIWLALAGVIGFFLPELWLRAKTARRNRAILRLLPEVIDLLFLCIGAGLDFLGALNKVLAVKGFRREPLIEELSVVMQEIRLGKRRSEALRAMAKRANVQELASFVRTMVQADRMGTPIREVLSVHSEDIRLQRFMRAERAALKAPIKILVPLIFCIMPSVGIIVGAPIFLQFMRQNPFGK